MGIIKEPSGTPKNAKSLFDKTGWSEMGAFALCEWANKKLASYKETDTNRNEEKPELPPLLEPLTKRETEILQALASGLSNKEIAIKLEVTEGTIKNHMVNIYGKFWVNNRVQAIVKARRYGIIF